MPSKPTLQSIADELGVSRSTVSNAYSRPEQLSAELREKILETARRLGYPGPNPAARSLRRGRAGAVGVLFTDVLPYAFADPYAVQFLRGLAESAEQARTGLLLIPLSETSDDGVETVRNASVDAFCLYCVPDGHPALEVIRYRGLPTVSAGCKYYGPDVSFIDIDERAATTAVGEHVVQLGHRRIAVISDWLVREGVHTTQVVEVAAPEDLPHHTPRVRLLGFHDALRSAGIDWSQVLVVQAGRNSREEGAAAAAYALDRAERPTAILCTTDVIALGVLDALRARGLRPGRDVSVTGYDDIPEAADAGLTTVHQPSIEKGRVVGELLLNPPGDGSGRRVVMSTSLVVRSSTGPAPAVS